MSNKINLDHAYETIVELIKQSGEYSRIHFGKTEVHWKNIPVSDWAGAKWYIARCVTPVDIACQNIILEGLIKEGFNVHSDVFAEETTNLVSKFNPDAQFQWVIDPIDGTFNYAMANLDNKACLEKLINHSLNITPEIYGITIGLRKKDEGFLFSAAYLPMLENLYLARREQGTNKNGVRQSMIQSPLSSSSKIHINSKLDCLKKVFACCEQPICTIYSTTCVADNTCQAFFARHSQLFDAGPASLIVCEAGGYICDEKGAPLNFGRLTKEVIIPSYIAGPNKEFNMALVAKGNLSNIDFPSKSI